MADSPLAQYLRLLRTSHDLKQDDVAQKLGVKRANYSHYENARLIPPTEVLCSIASFYDIPIDELLRLTLMSLEERKASGKEGDSESRSAVKASKITYSGFESLLKDFLNECTDMKNIDLNQWVTVEDREVLYHYHKLSKSNKQLLLSILRILAISDKN